MLLYLDGSILYVADSESSTIRSVSLNEGGGVKAVVGGALDPMVCSYNYYIIVVVYCCF